jgi:hypothetical protein
MKTPYGFWSAGNMEYIERYKRFLLIKKLTYGPLYEFGKRLGLGGKYYKYYYGFVKLYYRLIQRHLSRLDHWVFNYVVWRRE